MDQPKAQLFIEVIAPATPYNGDNAVSVIESLKFTLESADAFDADGMNRLNTRLHVMLGDLGFGPWTTPEWVRTVRTESEVSFHETCSRIAEFIREQHTVSC